MNDTAHSSIAIAGLSINFIVGDIAKQECDGVVNAANIYLRSGSGVCGALFAGAGFQLQPSCDGVIEKMGRNLDTSEAVITPGFNLPAKWIIHAVAPMCMGRWNDTIKTQMEETYRSIFRIADENYIATIAIPAMGLGVYQCDPQKSTQCLYDVVQEYAQHPERKIDTITFVLHSESILKLYKNLFGNMQNN